MSIDFSTMQVGEQREIGAGLWDDFRSVYEACIDYTKTVEPHPQFEFDRHDEKTRSGLDRWFVRRTR